MILVDLSMTREHGRECLKQIRNDSTLRDIPIIGLSTSRLQEDTAVSDQLGMNSFIAKPVTFAGS